MLACLFRRFFVCAVLVLTGWSSGILAQSIQFVTTADPLSGIAAGGSGDSRMPLLTHDGRFVLFASTANNLAAPGTNQPVPFRFPARLNVFRRDRMTGATMLVSVHQTGQAGGDADSLPLGISDDGRFALFQSQAGNLVSAIKVGPARTDIFLRDLENEATTLVSANTNGEFANGSSRDATLTADGRYIAFVSSASNLVPYDTNGIADVFVRDMQSGVTRLVSIGAVSTNAALKSGSSEAPQITPDGRFVAFYSTATNLVKNVTTPGQIFVRDLLTETTTWASAGARDAVIATLGLSNTVCFNHAISSDGAVVVYEASVPSGKAGVVLQYDLARATTSILFTNAAVPVASDYQFISSLAMTPDAAHVAFIANAQSSSNRTTCVKVWDASTATVTLESADLNGQVPPDSICDWPSIDDTGRYVAFLSTAPGLVTNATPDGSHVYGRDRQTGTTLLLDTGFNDQGSQVDPSTVPVLSGDGKVAAFDCGDGNLVLMDNNRNSDVFALDLTVLNPELISSHAPSLSSSTANGPSFLPSGSASADGRFVAFASEANNLVPSDTNYCRDIFVRDLQAGTTTLASVGANGSSADGDSWDPVISADGRYVAFTSIAGNLAGLETNHDRDVFVRDLLAGTTTLVSVNTNAVNSGNRASFSPIISSDGRFLIFQTKATDLNAGTPHNFFYRDLSASTNVPIPTTAALTPALSRDGQRVFYWDSIMQQALVWEPLSGLPPVKFTSVDPPGFNGLLPSESAFSTDGSKVAFCSYSPTLGLRVLNANDPSQPPVLINTNATQGVRWSSDGTKLVYIRTSNPPGTAAQIWLSDLAAGTSILVSHAYANPGIAADGKSDSADLSSDGRLIAYRSTSSNLVPSAPNSPFAIYLYDLATGANSLLAASSSPNSFVENRPLRPFFTGDGKSLLFASWAADLLPDDFNQNSDLFAYSFLFATLTRYVDPNQGSAITWPCTPGKNYRVEYKDDFSDPAWHPLAGSATLERTHAWIKDPQSNQNRIYRVVSF